jgi:hypothetical protein
MTIAITIKRADNSPDHDAEVRVFDHTAIGIKCLVEARKLGPSDETTINIWGTRSLEVGETTEPLATTVDVVEPIMQFFAYDHLPATLQTVSKHFGQLAQLIVTTLPRNAERTVALRKLLEAKDAGVRAILAKAPDQT